MSSPGASLGSPETLLQSLPQIPSRPSIPGISPQRPTSRCPTVSPRLPSHTSQEFSLPPTPIPEIAGEIFHPEAPNPGTPSPKSFRMPLMCPEKSSSETEMSSDPQNPPGGPSTSSHLPYTLPLHIALKLYLWTLPQIPAISPRDLMSLKSHHPEMP